jgi:glycosyltransferase involved in cell wall biosynthesis
LSKVREIVEYGVYKKLNVVGMDWDVNTTLNNFNKAVVVEKVEAKVFQEKKELSKSIGIVMPLYNQEKYVGKTIESLLRQTFKNWNLYVVNDGSLDRSKEIVDSFNDRRIVSVSHMKNMGISAALNTGFKLAKEPYLTWISGDNIYYEDCFSEMLNVMMSTRNVEFVYGNYDIIDKDDNFLRSVTNLPYDRKQLLDSYNLGICFLFTEQIKKSAGEYRAGYAQDYDMAVRMSQFGQFYRLDKSLGAFRQHEEQASTKNVSGDTKEVKELAKKVIKNR